MLIDSHCHLTDFVDFGDSADSADSAFLKKILWQAEKAGVCAFVSAASQTSDFSKILKLVENKKNVFATLGVHPFYAENFEEIGKIGNFVRLLNHPKIIGLGEIGLDFSPKHQFSANTQIVVLEKQLQIASDLQKPIVLHCVGKGASSTLLQILKKFKLGGILHAFGGSIEEAKVFIKLGFKISFNGNLLKPHFKRVLKLAETLPDSAILLESDSPCQVDELPNILKTLAQLRQTPIETLQIQIYQNTCCAFNYDFPR